VSIYLLIGVAFLWFYTLHIVASAIRSAENSIKTEIRLAKEEILRSTEHGNLMLKVAKRDGFPSKPYVTDFVQQ
jgi:hypothetical protein